MRRTGSSGHSFRDPFAESLRGHVRRDGG
jgi:hypothetical protein